MNNQSDLKKFLFGFLMNLGRKTPLYLIVVILLLFGNKKWVFVCIAGGILLLAFVWSFIQQIKIKKSANNEIQDAAKDRAKE